jgi:hypothetical protein
MPTRAVVLLGLLCLWGLAGSVSAEPAKPRLRFAFVGCNRVGFSELTPDNPSSANRQQLLRTCQDLVADPPAYLFLVGDIVTNYGQGSELLRSQLEPWVELYQSTELANSGTVMVPIVGNHEVLTSRQDPETGRWTDFPNPETLPVWESVMAPYLRWSDGPTREGENLDGLSHDQSKLSFTVRHQDVLFLCINTDTFIDDTTLGDVPLHWIAEKLAQAERDPEIKHVFLLGHKPVLCPDLPGDIVRAPENLELDLMMARHSKVRAFLTAHFHLWDYRRTPQGNVQIIAGNGGTNPSGQFNAHGKGYFGYTVVELFDDGAWRVENWGRPIPQPYDSNQPQPPARKLESMDWPAPAP